VDLQEFMIMPVGAGCFKEALRMCVEVYYKLKLLLKKRGLSTSVGDEGGFAPDLGDTREVLDCIVEAIGMAGFNMEHQMKIAIDAAGRSMKRVWSVLYVPCPYTFYERLKLEVAAFDGIIRDTQFGAEVELEILIAREKTTAFLEKLTDMTSGTVEGMETAQEYRAFPIT